MKKNKILFTGIFFLLLVNLTFFVLFKNQGLFSFLEQIRTVNPIFIGIGCFFMILFILFEGINIFVILKTFSYSLSFGEALKYACVGFFFSSITPSASGGEPAQLYCMVKDTISSSHATLTLLLELFCYQVLTFLYAILGLLCTKEVFITLGNLKYIFFLGIGLNLFFIFCLFMLLFYTKISSKIIDFFKKLIEKIVPTKAELLNQKIDAYIEEYLRCSTYIKEHKRLIFKLLLYTGIRLFCYYSIPYFVYLSFGYREEVFDTFFFVEALLYISVCSLPVPGALVVSEGGFLLLFRLFYPDSILNSAMLLSRGISFYIPILFTGILLIFAYIVEKISKKKRM